VSLRILTPMATSSVDNITCTVEDGVARVWLDRPDKLNALTLDMLAELTATSRRLRSDRTLRAVVLAGAGRSFSAGLDMGAARRNPRKLASTFLPSPVRGTNVFQEAAWGWRRLPVPVVAAVQGHCYGGGLQIALGADFRISTPDAQWSVMEARWGLVPDMSGARSLAQLVGIDTAKLLTMTGDPVTGAQALQLGLVTEVAEDPLSAADALVERLRGRSPDALAATKRLLDSTWCSGPRRTFARERAAQLSLLLAPNTRIAREAASRREPAVFTARKR
jgi:enoyl-CoA hydratase/carnithine racemase